MENETRGTKRIRRETHEGAITEGLMRSRMETVCPVSFEVLKILILNKYYVSGKNIGSGVILFLHPLDLCDVMQPTRCLQTLESL